MHFPQANTLYLKSAGKEEYNRSLQSLLDQQLYPYKNFDLVVEGRMRGETGAIRVLDHFPDQIEFKKESRKKNPVFKLFKHEDLKNLIHNYMHTHECEVIPLPEDYDKH